MEQFHIKFPDSGKTESGVIKMMHFLHSTNRTGPYFEGWYLKHQTLQGQALALIPAFHIVRASDKMKENAEEKM